MRSDYQQSDASEQGAWPGIVVFEQARAHGKDEARRLPIAPPSKVPSITRRRCVVVEIEPPAAFASRRIFSVMWRPFGFGETGIKEDIEGDGPEACLDGARRPARQKC